MLPNETIVIQLAIYVFLLMTLYYTFFKPLMGIIEERSRRAEGRLHEAEARVREFEELYQRYSQRIDAAKKVFFDEKAGRIRAAEAEAEKIYAAGKKKLEEDFTRVQREIGVETASFRVELFKSKSMLKEEIMEKILHG